MNNPRRLAALMLALAALWPSAAMGADDPGRAKQWGLDVIGAPAAWRVSRGAGITIAIVDSGVDLNHEDLRDNLVPGRNFVEPGTPPQDDNGHGSHVAGIAAAVAGNGVGISGVAPGAKIMPVRVLGNSCSGSSCTASGSTDDIVAGIRWAVDNGARVINLSLGEDALYRNVFGSALTDGIDYAWNHGVIPVVTAGNNSIFPSGYGNTPALVVVATDRNDEWASYSNKSGLLSGARWGIAAPGGSGDGTENDILSSYWIKGKTNQYAYAAGTSMAAPHVSAAAAILLSLGLTPQQTVDRLLATSTDLGSPGPDATFGAGRLDLAKAVSGLGGKTPASASLAAAPSPAHSASHPPSSRPSATSSVAPTATAAAPSAALGPTGQPLPTTPGSPAVRAAAPRPVDPGRRPSHFPAALAAIASAAALLALVTRRLIKQS